MNKQKPTLLSACCLLSVLLLPSFSNAQNWSVKKAPLMTKWAANVDINKPLPEYPRPQMVRKDWMNLNGLWEFKSGKSDDAIPVGQTLPGKILVPFPVESALSGVMEHHDRLWYRRNFSIPAAWNGKRTMIHFGAIDWESEIIYQR